MRKVIIKYLKSVIAFNPQINPRRCIEGKKVTESEYQKYEAKRLQKEMEKKGFYKGQLFICDFCSRLGGEKYVRKTAK